MATDPADNTSHFAQVTHNEHVLWEAIKNTVTIAVNTAYGTDPRHSLLAYAVADEIAYGKPMPWSLADHFNRDTPEPEPEPEPAETWVRYKGNETFQQHGATSGLYILHSTDELMMCGYVEIRDQHGRIFPVAANLLEVVPAQQEA